MKKQMRSNEPNLKQEYSKLCGIQSSQNSMGGYFGQFNNFDLMDEHMDDQIAVILFGKRFDELEGSDQIKECPSDSYVMNCINEKSIHFSKLEEQSIVEKEGSKNILENLETENCDNEYRKRRIKKQDVINEVSEFKKKVWQSNLTVDCKNRCLDYIAKIVQVVTKDLNPSIKNSFKDILKNGHSFRKLHFR